MNYKQWIALISLNIGSCLSMVKPLQLARQTRTYYSPFLPLIKRHFHASRVPTHTPGPIIEPCIAHDAIARFMGSSKLWSSCMWHEFHGAVAQLCTLDLNQWSMFWSTMAIKLQGKKLDKQTKEFLYKAIKQHHASIEKLAKKEEPSISSCFNSCPLSR